VNGQAETGAVDGSIDTLTGAVAETRRRSKAIAGILGIELDRKKWTEPCCPQDALDQNIAVLRDTNEELTTICTALSEMVKTIGK